MSLPLHFEPGPGLSLALALAVGMVAQSLARPLRLPGIVLLLAAGVLLGPDGAGLVLPAQLGPFLPLLVGFAVAIVLFEGAMNLDFARLRRERRSIRNLVTVGALVTWAGGATAARWWLGWDWILCFLFGSLVIVTGPTVVQPLLRRIRVRSSVATVLEAEGILIDAVGAVLAVLALEIVLHPARGGLAAGAAGFVVRLLLGALAGIAGGAAIAALLRFRRLVPEGFENVFTLSLVLALFQGTNAFLEETGIVAVTAAGLVVANVKTRALADLKEFKEQLTVLLIGALFVLLAADVRLSEVTQLGWAGLGVVVTLMLVVRPLDVAVSTAGSELAPRERLFLAWMAPRGIVAAAVASLFAQQLTANGLDGGPRLRALVFLVIAVTVVVQGLSGGIVARLLGVSRPRRGGTVILGAGPVARAIAGLLRGAGDDVVLVDSNPTATRAAEEADLAVVFGNGLEERTLQRAEAEDRERAVALTSNEEVNLLFAQRCRSELRVPEVLIALRHAHAGVTPAMVDELEAHVLFGSPRDLAHWTVRLQRGEAGVEAWEVVDAAAGSPFPPGDDGTGRALLPLARERDGRCEPWDERTTVKEGDRVHVAVLETRRSDGEAWLRSRGLAPAPTGEALG
ncbi:MAG: cation:proton antiporter [Thermoanaerobaculia bacterium]